MSQPFCAWVQTCTSLLQVCERCEPGCAGTAGSLASFPAAAETAVRADCHSVGRFLFPLALLLVPQCCLDS